MCALPAPHPSKVELSYFTRSRPIAEPNAGARFREVDPRGGHFDGRIVALPQYPCSETSACSHHEIYHLNRRASQLTWASHRSRRLYRRSGYDHNSA